MINNKGTVYWITGLSGAGKTTIGNMFSTRLRKESSSVIYLDGDVLREVFDKEYSHTPDERRALAMQYARLCRILADQGTNIVCSTISMFHEIHEWNRNNIERYVEIYLKVPMDVLITRDQKSLYSRALNAKVANVIGIDVDAEEPKFPDITLVNDGKSTPDSIVSDLWSQLLKSNLLRLDGYD